MSDVAIAISILSFLVSGITLFLTQFRPPKLKCIVGSTIGLNHQDDGFSVYMPVTFTNEAHQPGLINRCSVLITPEGASSSFYIEWTEFRKRDDEKKTYGRDEFAGPLQVQGRSSISKLVWFYWREGEFNFPDGRYTVEVFVWAENKDAPHIRQRHEFFLDVTESGALKNHKTNGKRTIEWVSVDKQIEPNKMLTVHEAAKLLGGK